MTGGGSSFNLIKEDQKKRHAREKGHDALMSCKRSGLLAKRDERAVG
jgi:hypothetical protein